jgi:DNA modification methylase
VLFDLKKGVIIICDICLHTPCHPRCPNAPDPPIVFYCDICNDPIYEGDLVLDNCIGSGTTAIACINTNRNYIGFELDKEYYELAKNRINKHIIDNNLQDKYSLIT